MNVYSTITKESIMSAFDPGVYGTVFADLFKNVRLMPLGPSVGNSSAKTALEALDLEQAFAPHHISDRTMAEGCRSAVWLDLHGARTRSSTCAKPPTPGVSRRKISATVFSNANGNCCLIILFIMPSVRKGAAFYCFMDRIFSSHARIFSSRPRLVGS